MTPVEPDPNIKLLKRLIILYIVGLPIFWYFYPSHFFMLFSLYSIFCIIAYNFFSNKVKKKSPSSSGSYHGDIWIEIKKRSNVDKTIVIESFVYGSPCATVKDRSFVIHHLKDRLDTIDHSRQQNNFSFSDHYSGRLFYRTNFVKEYVNREFSHFEETLLESNGITKDELFNELDKLLDNSTFYNK